MATISNARKQELIELYDNLKVLVLNVEAKYSTDARPITIDFPPTLGLTKLTYTKHTQVELEALAMKETAATYAGKASALEKSYDSNVNSVKYMRNAAKANHEKSLENLNNSYDQAVIKTEHKLVDNGLWHSSMKDEALAAEKSAYDKKVSDEKKVFKEKDDAFAERLSKMAANYEKSKSQLVSQRQADVAATAQKLAEKEEREARAVEKYNASVDEKEAKYQASCQRYLRYAQQAEDQRVIAILKIYAQLGASGVEQRMKTEVLSTCRSELSVCTKGEAAFIFELDTFLQVHLGSYYSTLVDWAKTTLRPDPN